MNYYISDLHFNSINKWDNRTLETDNIIINNWNKTVTNSDHVYILGDIGKFGNNKENEYLCKCISVLKGKKHLIIGNHDKLKDQRISQLFVEICDYKELYDNFNGLNYYLILSHYPILFWNGQHKGNIHLYGHVHKSNEWELYKDCLEKINNYFLNKELKGYKNCPQAKAYNVGGMLDYINYTPRTLKEIIKSNKYY